MLTDDGISNNNDVISERCGKNSNDNKGNIEENIENTWYFLILV